MLIMLIFIEFCTEKKKDKAQGICENQVSDTGPLGLLFGRCHHLILPYRVSVTTMANDICTP